MKFPPFFFAAFLALASSLCAQQPKAERTAEGAVTPAIKDQNRHVKFLERIQEDKEINLLFLGDSITDGWPRGGEVTWLKFAPYKPANFGIGGDKTEHLLWRITNGELEGFKPKVVVIMIGTNNIRDDTKDKPEWVAGGIKKIVQTVREKLPESKILLLAVFPRADKNDPRYEMVREINKEVVKLKLEEDSQVHYLDIGDVFLDSHGEIPSDVMPDKLHPAAKGYALWYKAMQPTLDKLMQE
jgi:lysophospholipase L1-like esterase